ncbi:hypothetical protein AAMO2058_000698200 [Amorphochlora amoebiformis]
MPDQMQQSRSTNDVEKYLRFQLQYHRTISQVRISPQMYSSEAKFGRPTTPLVPFSCCQPYRRNTCCRHHYLYKPSRQVEADPRLRVRVTKASSSTPGEEVQVPSDLCGYLKERVLVLLRMRKGWCGRRLGLE